jgi:hypothetical protein
MLALCLHDTHQEKKESAPLPARVPIPRNADADWQYEFLGFIPPIARFCALLNLDRMTCLLQSTSAATS